MYELLTLIYRRWSPEPTQQTQASAGRSIADKWTDQMAGNLFFFGKKLVKTQGVVLYSLF